MITKTTGHCLLKKEQKRKKETNSTACCVLVRTDKPQYEQQLNRWATNINMHKSVFREGIKKRKQRQTLLRNAQWNYKGQWTQPETWEILVIYQDYYYFFFFHEMCSQIVEQGLREVTLCPWRYPKVNWTRPWATFASWLCLVQRLD